MVPNLINITVSSETEFGGVVNGIYLQYFTNMLMGKIDIETGTAELSKKWREQGGDKILKEVNQALKDKK
ncbi:hypothetical protein D3C73_846880 [compost metagenome]